MGKTVLFVVLCLFTFFETANAREYFSSEITYTLYKQTVLTQKPVVIGGPLSLSYQFSDDGKVVLENNVRQRGVSLSGNSADVKFSVTATSLQYLVEKLLENYPEFGVEQIQVQSFLALSIVDFDALSYRFSDKEELGVQFYQLHSPYINEDETSYHLYVSVKRPVKINY